VPCCPVRKENIVAQLEFLPWSTLHPVLKEFSQGIHGSIYWIDRMSSSYSSQNWVQGRSIKMLKKNFFGKFPEDQSSRRLR
jgi:hypothetical protein